MGKRIPAQTELALSNDAVADGRSRATADRGGKIDYPDVVKDGSSIVREFTYRSQGAGNSVHFGPGVRVRGLQLHIDGNNNHIRFRRNSHINACRISIDGEKLWGNFSGEDNIIEIGADTELSEVTIDIRGSGNCLETGFHVYAHEDTVLCLHGYGCAIRIGDGTSIKNASLSADELATSITVGRDVMIAAKADISTGDKHPVFRAGTFERLNCAESIVIGDHVWVAGSARLLRGTRIADNSVVGTHAVVYRPGKFHHGAPSADESVSAWGPNAIIGGVPAKVAHVDRGWTREMIFDHERSGSTLQKYPDAKALSHCHRGHALMRRGNRASAMGQHSEAESAYQQAIGEYEQAVAGKEDYVFAHCAVGIAHIQVAQNALLDGRLAESRWSFEVAEKGVGRALDHNPHHDDSLLGRDAARAAQRQLAKLSTAEASTADEHCALGFAHYRIADVQLRFVERRLAEIHYKRAVSSLLQALENDPAHAESRRGREEVFAQLKDLGWDRLLP